MLRFSFFFILIILVFLASLSLAGIPKMINYQGMLTDNSGTPLSGSYNLTFKIWTDTTGGSTLWTETQSGVEVQNGLFNVVLGRLTTLNLPFDQQYWLEVLVGVDTMPRIRFTSVGYAYRAEKADSAIAVASYPHNHDADYVNVTGPDSIRTTGADADAFRVKTYGPGSANGIEINTWGVSADGIYMDTVGDDGIQMFNVGGHGVDIDDVHGDGVHIDNISQSGIYMTDVTSYGAYMSRIHNDGINMTDVDSIGIYMDDVGDDGIYIEDAGGIGLHTKLADYGVYIDSTRSPFDAVRIRYSEDDGCRVDHADDDGMSVIDAGGEGVYVSHADNYGLYIYDSDDDGIRVASADSDGIQVYGAAGGGEVYSLSSGYYGLRVHSYNDLSSNAGLWVYGYGGISGTWSTKLSSPSGDVPGFMVTSRDVEIIASGTGTLVSGKAEIIFDQKFQGAISSEVPIRVVVTAQDAPSALLYVTNKSHQGFTVKPLEIPELSLKTDDVSFDWIAIARQKGYEQRPQVLTSDEEKPTDWVSRWQEEMKAEETKHQRELQQDALYRQQMLEKQARREAGREKKEREEQEGKE